MNANVQPPESPQSRVLLICHESVGKNMAGPAIRYWELATALSRHFQVTLAHHSDTDGEGPGFHVSGYDRQNPQSLAPVLAWADTVVLHGYLLHKLPIVRSADKPLTIDIYDPFIFENLEHYRYLPAAGQGKVGATDLAILNGELRRGDFFVCASERQRDFWLGMLAANGRINPYTYGNDRTLRMLIDVVPFGLRSTPPQKTRPVLKGIHPAIARSDKLLLWGGGLWDWFDPETLIKGLAKVCEHRRDVKLFFMAKQHFDDLVVPQMRAAKLATKLARELGLLDKHVFFGDWTPYEDRANYLLEADIGVSLHLEGVETDFAFRTRLMDYIWAGLPVLATRGDMLGEMVESEGLGRTVLPGDVVGVAGAINQMLEDESLRSRLAPSFARMAERFTWERVAEPLVRFLSNPAKAVDRQEGNHGRMESDTEDVPVLHELKPPSVSSLPVKAWQSLRHGGPRTLAWEVRRYLQWRRASRRAAGTRPLPLRRNVDK